MYLLKIKGSGKIPDSLQVRDDEYNLKAYVILKNLRRGLEKNGFEAHVDELEKMVNEREFNEVFYFNDTIETSK